MKLNPKIFEGFTDPEGGQWIKIKSGVYADTVWRPHDLSMTDDGLVSFRVEFFEGPGFKVPAPTDSHFENVAGGVLQELLQEAAAQEVAEAQIEAGLKKDDEAL